MEKEIINLNDEIIENMIYEIRGQRVMLDFELAKILGYETRTLNQQVQRNNNKFELNQRFQLTKNELDELLMSQIVTSSDASRSQFVILNEGRGKNIKYLPYAFTEQGIYTLLTVLKGEAVNINGKKIIDYFNNLKNAKIWPSEAKNLDIVKFERGDIIIDVRISPDEDTVWLTQNDMAILYDTTKQLISFHINNIFDQNELEKEAVVKKNLTTAIDGKTYNMTYYNLDVIFAVGYRINTKRGIEFRRWANNILKQYLIKGYSINTKRCLEHSDILLNIREELFNIINKVNKNDIRLDKIEEQQNRIMNYFDDPNTHKHYLFYNGNRIESDIAFQNIFKTAKKSLYLIDDYIDIKTLQLLKISKVRDVIIFSDNKAKNNINNNYINDFKKDSRINILFKENKGRCHSRYIIIDYGLDDWDIYLCGGSIKDGGDRVNTILKIEEKEEYINMINDLLKNKMLIIK